MATRTFESLVHKVNPSVQGCPFPMIVQHIRDAAIRTCERTLTWRYVEPVYSLTPGVHEYAYRKPLGSEVHAVFAAIVNDYPLEILTLDDAIDRQPKWADYFSGVYPASLWTGGGAFNLDGLNEVQFNNNGSFTLTEEALAEASDPRVFTQVTPDRFVVLPLPGDDEPYRLRLFYALKPKQDAESMPAAIMDDLSEAIIHSALQELLVISNKPWTDRELASYHAKQYAFKVTERRARANLGNARATMSVKMRPFA